MKNQNFYKEFWQKIGIGLLSHFATIYNFKKCNGLCWSVAKAVNVSLEWKPQGACFEWMQPE